MCALKGTLCACGAFDFAAPIPSEYQSGVAIVDGVVVPRDLQQALQREDWHIKVPTLAGAMAEESSRIRFPSDPAVFTATLQNWTASFSLSDATLANLTLFYNGDTDEFAYNWAIAWDAIISDIRVVCGCLANTRRLASSCGQSPGKCDVWQYYSDMHAVANTSWGAAFHGFDVRQIQSVAPTNPAELAVWTNAVDLFATFVKTHAPPTESGFRRFGDSTSFGTGAGYDSGYQLNILGQAFQVQESRLRDRCLTWANAIPYGQGGSGWGSWA